MAKNHIYEVQYMYFSEFKTIKTFNSEKKAWEFIHSCAKNCGDWIYDILVVTH
jgi:hypothetical protein